MSVAPWKRILRDPRPSQHEGRFDCLVWLSSELTEFDFSAVEDGFPGGEPRPKGAEATTRLSARPSDEPELDPFFLQPVPAGALREVEEDFAQLMAFNRLLDPKNLPECQHGLVVAADFPDPDDLSHLQTATAILRGLARLGAVAFFDLLSQRFWDWDEMLALEPERSFVIREHVSLQIRPDELPLTGLVCQTRGMLKFARPDIFLRGFTEPNARMVSDFVNELAYRAALGADLHSSLILELPHPTGTLSPITFRAYPDDTLDMRPLHGLGQNAFANASIEVVDFDSANARAGAGCPILLGKAPFAQP